MMGRWPGSWYIQDRIVMRKYKINVDRCAGTVVGCKFGRAAAIESWSGELFTYFSINYSTGQNVCKRAGSFVVCTLLANQTWRSSMRQHIDCTFKLNFDKVLQTWTDRRIIDSAATMTHLSYTQQHI